MNIGRKEEVKIYNPANADTLAEPPSIIEMLPYIGAGCGLFLIALAIFGIIKLI